MLLTEQEARKAAETMLRAVKAGDATASVSSEIQSYVRFAANTFQTSAQTEDRSAAVTLWIDGRRGSASTNDLDERSLRETVARAEAIAGVAPLDREYVPTLGPQTYRPTNAFAEATATIATGSRARAIADAITLAEKARVIAAGFHRAEAVAAATATRNGNFSYQRTSLASFAVTARTVEGDGSGYFLRTHFDAHQMDLGRVAREAIRRAQESRGARALPPGVYPVILEPQAVADLMATGLNFDARSADEGRSPFSAPLGQTRLGETLFDERLNIFSDPWRKELPGSQAAPSGLPADVVYFVRNGVLETLTYSRFWAREKGKPATPGPVNRIMESSAPPVSMEALIRDTRRALLVGRFWYIRGVDPRTATLTGLTRDGMWLVENGKIQHPVRNLRFNQSIIQMLAPGNVEAIGPAERVAGSESQGTNNALLPALRLRAFTFTSASDAV